MARKRMIDPGIWQSEDFSKLSTLAKLVFIGLFSNADDEGRGRAKAAYIKSILFPYDEGMRVIDVDKTLSEIASNMSVTFYLHDDNEYYSLDKWSKWQRVDKPSDSVLPKLDENSMIIRRAFQEHSENVPGSFPPNRKEEKEKGKEEKGKETRAPARGHDPPIDTLITTSEAYTQNPDVLDAIAGYLEMRKAKQKPATARALKSVFRELDKLSRGDDALRIAILEQSTRNSWTDVYALKQEWSQTAPAKKTGATFADLYREEYGEEVKIGGS